MKPESMTRVPGTSTKYGQQFYGKTVSPSHFVENPDHSQQPVRTQQNFYPGGDDYNKRPESAGNAK